MKLVVKNNMDEMAEWTANYICKKINEFHPNEKKYFIIGFSASDHLLSIYNFLVKFYKEGKVSFKYMKAFQTDEYVDPPHGHQSSNHAKLFKSFFQHVDVNPPHGHQSSNHAKLFKSFFQQVDVKPENVFMLNGKAEDLKVECRKYEKRIENEGGLHLCLVSAGDEGEVGFNETDSSLMSRTREVRLSERAMLSLADREFTRKNWSVPKSVLTLGIGTIMDYAEEVLIITSGPNRSQYVHYAMEKGINSRCGISIFHKHPSALLICDREATYDLKASTLETAKNDCTNMKCKGCVKEINTCSI